MALVATNISKTIKKRVLVDSVSLKIEYGEIVGLLGPNGAGKTTCFYLILGLYKSDLGSITIDGKDITSLPLHVRTRYGIGYLPQEPSIFRGLRVFENILGVLELRQDLNKSQRNTILEELLAEFNLTKIRNSYGVSLSGGERRRVEIARTLACSPKIILLDEPFAGVDPISIGDIKDLIRKLAKKKIGILITDHNVRETLAICDKAYILNSGKTLAKGSPNAILANEEVKRVYLGDSFVI